MFEQEPAGWQKQNRAGAPHCQCRPPGSDDWPQPIALLARLGVDERHEGQGLGDAIGCRGLLVHAESKEVRSFYEHLIPEFERSPTDPLHLLPR